MSFEGTFFKLFHNFIHFSEVSTVKKDSPQLQQFIEYKALEQGIPVVYVDPEYTSQMCPKCGYTERSNRDRKNTTLNIKNAVTKRTTIDLHRSTSEIVQLYLDIFGVHRVCVNYPYVTHDDFET